jgi:hypothetical protein
VRGREEEEEDARERADALAAAAAALELQREMDELLRRQQEGEEEGRGEVTYIDGEAGDGGAQEDGGAGKEGGGEEGEDGNRSRGAVVEGHPDPPSPIAMIERR